MLPLRVPKRNIWTMYKLKEFYFNVYKQQTKCSDMIGMVYEILMINIGLWMD